MIALTPLVTIAAVLGYARLFPGSGMAAGLDALGLAGGLVVVVGSVMTALGRSGPAPPAAGTSGAPPRS